MRIDGEVRAEKGRRLSGTVLRYGDVSLSHAERFEPGAFDLGATVALNLEHRARETVAWTGGGGLHLQDSRADLRMTAEVPETPAGDFALESVRAGRLRGLSVEFRARDEYTDRRGLRVVRRADLTGIGIVRAPAYGDSSVEARRRRGYARARIPTGVRLPCDCVQGDCSTIVIERYALDDAIAAASGPGSEDIIAIGGRAERGIASVRKGSMVIEADGEGGYVVDLLGAAAGTVAAADMVDTSRQVPMFARPVFDQAASEFGEDGEVATFRRMKVRAILFKPIVGDAGDWPVVDVDETARSVRRFPAWL